MGSIIMICVIWYGVAIDWTIFCIHKTCTHGRDDYELDGEGFSDSLEWLKNNIIVDKRRGSNIYTRRRKSRAHGHRASGMDLWHTHIRGSTYSSIATFDSFCFDIFSGLMYGPIVNKHLTNYRQHTVLHEGCDDIDSTSLERPYHHHKIIPS